MKKIYCLLLAIILTNTSDTADAGMWTRRDKRVEREKPTTGLARRTFRKIGHGAMRVGKALGRGAWEVTKGAGQVAGALLSPY